VINQLLRLLGLRHGRRTEQAAQGEQAAASQVTPTSPITPSASTPGPVPTVTSGRVTHLRPKHKPVAARSMATGGNVRW
jgi:hypothetical protein